jgi:hypothetical protein
LRSLASETNLRAADRAAVVGGNDSAANDGCAARRFASDGVPRRQLTLAETTPGTGAGRARRLCRSNKREGDQ